MKVKTLVKALAYPVDEVEMYSENWDLISKMELSTLVDCYGDMKVDKFHIHETDGWTILEVILK